MKGQRIIRVFLGGANRLRDPAEPVLRFRALFFGNRHSRVSARNSTRLFVCLLPLLPFRSGKERAMKYRYAFTTGAEEVEISEEWAAVLEEMDHEQQLSDRRESRRHQSLDDLLYEGLDFAAEGNAESPLLEKEDGRELAAALSGLTEIQRRRLLMHCEGMTLREIAKLENVNFQKIGKSVDQAKKILKKSFE